MDMKMRTSQISNLKIFLTKKFEEKMCGFLHSSYEFSVKNAFRKVATTKIPAVVKI